MSKTKAGRRWKGQSFFRLLADSKPGDVLLTEQIDRVSRLSQGDWKRLRAIIEERQVRLVALDLPTSYGLLRASEDDFSARILSAINSMMLDMLAAISRKDYEDRRRRVAEGQRKAQEAGKYRGRPEDAKRNTAIASMLSKGMSWTDIQSATGCSRATIAKVAARIREVAEAA